MSRPLQKLLELRLASGEETQSGTPARSYEVGLVRDLPWPLIDEPAGAILDQRCQDFIEVVRAKWMNDETSLAFVQPFPVECSLRQAAERKQRNEEARVANLLKAAGDIDVIVARQLGFSESEREVYFGEDAATLSSKPETTLRPDFDELYVKSVHEVIRGRLDEAGGNREIAVKSFCVSRHIELLSKVLNVHPSSIVKCAAERHLLPAELVVDAAEDCLSYAVGCLCGRWDVRLATEDCKEVGLSDPFMPLPVCAPGMIRANNGLPVIEIPKNYPLRIDSDGIIPDDPDHDDDIVGRVREVLEVIWKDRADTIEKEACEILGIKELRDYFRKPGKGGFWDDHVSRYSKSRRKAPIYWLLQSSKKNYGLWLYYHRLDKDILFKARQNYVDPKIRLEQTRVASLRSQKIALGADAKGAKKIDKDIERQEILLSELNDFAEKLERAAKLNFGNPEKLNSEVVCDPDLNDGVVLNIAPLWELVPWKEAKKYWHELLEGKYEWSSMGKLLRKKGLVKG
jgi:hypothetical protein